jgi:hypothetical protein
VLHVYRWIDPKLQKGIFAYSPSSIGLVVSPPIPLNELVVSCHGAISNDALLQVWCVFVNVYSFVNAWLGPIPLVEVPRRPSPQRYATLVSKLFYIHWLNEVRALRGRSYSFQLIIGVSLGSGIRCDREKPPST